MVGLLVQILTVVLWKILVKKIQFQKCLISNLGSVFIFCGKPLRGTLYELNNLNLHT